MFCVIGDRINEKTKTNSEIYFQGEKLSINTHCYTVSVNGKIIELLPKEFNTLFLLARHPGWVYTKEEIFENVYKKESLVNIDNIIFCLIYSLRKKMEPNPKYPQYIRNVRGIGYKIIADIQIE